MRTCKLYLNIVIGVIGGVIGGVAATKIAENPEQLDSYISDAIGDNSDNLVDGDELGNFVCDVTDVSKTTDANGKPAILVTYYFKTIRIQQLILIRRFTQSLSKTITH